jgi:hypothetical protein
MIAHEMGARSGHEGGESGEEVEGLEARGSPARGRGDRSRAGRG